VLPLVRVKSLLFGDYLVSMPFVNYGGPLGSPEAVRALAHRAQEMAEGLGVGLLELRSRAEQDTGLPASHRKITVVLDLPSGGAEALWKGLPAKVRSQVRRPQKEGMETRFGAEQLDAFYDVFARHMRDLGTPVQSRRLFEAIGETLGPDVWFGCVYHGARPVAGGCGFRWGTEFEMTWASSLREYNAAAPNMLLYWSFMERCAAEGVTLFNFGRCTPGSGTHRFKRQWGSRDEQLWWYQWSRSGKTATPSPDDGALAWGPRLWRRLPLPVANALGPWIVKKIP
jgi:FemAB-related protein (PEP-CTERM system-associated)